MSNSKIKWQQYSEFRPNKFMFQKKVYHIDEFGFWVLTEGDTRTLCWGEPWIENGKLSGSRIDPKIYERIKQLDNKDAQISWLNRMSNDSSIAAFEFMSPPRVKRVTKICDHVSWSDRTKGRVCNHCTTYHIVEPERPKFIRV